ncbi:hypothetical protein D3C72_1464160 [compost metagenome]
MHRRDRAFGTRHVRIQLQVQHVGADAGVGQRHAEQVEPVQRRAQGAGVQPLHQVQVELDADGRTVERRTDRAAVVDRRLDHLRPQAHVGHPVEAQRGGVDRDRRRRGEHVAEVVELHAAGQQVEHVQPHRRQRTGGQCDLQDVGQPDAAVQPGHAERQGVEYVGCGGLAVGLQYLHHRRAQLAQGDVGIEHLAGITHHHAAVELGQQRVEVDVGPGQVVPVGHAQVERGARQQRAEQQIEQRALGRIDRGQARPGTDAGTGGTGRLRLCPAKA